MDLLKAARAFRYARKDIRPGDKFVTASEDDTKVFVLSRMATVLEKNVTPLPPPKKKRKGRQTYRTRDMVAGR